MMPLRTNEARSSERILWAIDALSEYGAVQTVVAEMLCHWIAQTGARVEPVCVINKKKLNAWLQTASGFPSRVSPEEVARPVQQWAAAQSGLRALPLKVLTRDGGSLHDSVDCLLQYAAEIHAATIATSASGKQGMARFALGSFAESLLARSPIPVLICNAHVETIGTFATILVPSDFSEASRRAFELAVIIADELHAQIVLFHELPSPTPMGLVPGAAPGDFDRLLRREREIEAQQWLDWANERGVPARARFDCQHRPISRAILGFARHVGADLIVMASERSELPARLLGSVTRAVTRNANCPVLALHPSARTEKLLRAA